MKVKVIQGDVGLEFLNWADDTLVGTLKCEDHDVVLEDVVKGTRVSVTSAAHYQTVWTTTWGLVNGLEFNAADEDTVSTIHTMISICVATSGLRWHNES